MNLKSVAVPAIVLSALGGAAASPASAMISIGDTLDVTYDFRALGIIYDDSGDFTYTGPGQSLTIQFGLTTVFLDDNEVAFAQTPGCGVGCTENVASWNGPVMTDLTNANAFSGWHVLADTVGITSSYLTPSAVGVNWQGAAVQGEVVVGVPFVGVPEPSTWAMMALGFLGLGFAGHRASAKSPQLSMRAQTE
jgi:hypothetical protein